MTAQGGNLTAKHFWHTAWICTVDKQRYSSQSLTFYIRLQNCYCWCFSVAKSCQLFLTSWTTTCQVPLSSTISWSLLKFTSIESVRVSTHFILCYFLLLLASVFPSIRVFSSESTLRITWPKYWSFSISPSSDYSALISFRIDWFDLLTVQGTLKSLLQLAPFSGLVLDLDSTPLLHLAQNDYMASWCPALC